MGTRSMTKVYDNRGNVLVAMYRQSDGYPEGHGKDLAAFLASGRLVNGLGGEKERIFNGAHCLAAQMVSEFKTEPGGIYLYPTNCDGEEWNYEVRVDRIDQEVDPVTISVNALGKERFKGTRSKFVTYCANPLNEEE